MKISIERLSKELEGQGLTPDQIFNFLAIARGESGYLFEAQNPKDNDNSWGLFQINFTKGAGGVERAKALGIPVKADGLPTLAGLAKYFGLKRNADGTYSVRDGVSEEELIEANLDALMMMWNGKDYRAWSVHPDNAKFDENQRAQDLWYGTDDTPGHVSFVTQVLKDSNDPTLNTILVEAQKEWKRPEGADVDQWPDIQTGRPEDPQFPPHISPKAQYDEEIARIVAARNARVGDDVSVPPWVFSEEEEAAIRAARNELYEGGTTDLSEEESAALREELLAAPPAFNEFGEIEMGEEESEALTGELLAQPRMVRESYTKDGEEVFFEAIQMGEEESAAFAKSLGFPTEDIIGKELTDEEAEFLRETLGPLSLWKQDLDDFMITTDDGRRMNIVDWIADNEDTMSDQEMLRWINETPYFQGHAQRQRNWDSLWFDAGPGVRQQLLEDPSQVTKGANFGRSAILREAQKIGFNWLADNPALLDKLAYDSGRFAWDEYDVRRALAGINTFETAEVARGTILGFRQNALDSAAKYYMPLSAEGADDLAWGMYLGEETLSSVEAMYRQQAKGQFPSLAGLIDQGVSMQAYFDPYKQRIGQLLEMPDVDLMNDPRLQPIMFPGSGQGPMSLSEAQTFARQLPEWQYTKNAEDAARSLTDNVGRMMGVVA